MSKNSKAERLAAIQAVEKGESIKDVGRRYHINDDVLSLCLRLYKEHGAEGLHSHAYNWTAEQKYQVLDYMHENHLSCRETGIKFGISGSSTVWQWEHKYLENGIEGLEDKKKGRKPRTQKPKPPKTREEELLEENLYLRAENEYLKKLNALVAEREKHEKGNR
jgi:transposase